MSACNNFKFYNNGINSMTIQKNGSVGIGTTANFLGAFKLDVRGNACINNSFTTIDPTYSFGLTQQSASTFSQIQTGSVSSAYCPDLRIQEGGGNLKLGNPTSNIYLNSFVGIGTGVNASTWKLDVRGYIGANAIFVAENGNYGDGQYQLQITPPNATTPSSLQTIRQNTSYAGNIIIQAFGGNVGIGVVSPNNVLQVGSGGRLRIANSNADYTLIGTNDIDNTSNTKIVLSGHTRTTYTGQIEYVSTVGGHIFYTNSSTERMRILANGNVGIGTNNPNCKLDIRGVVNITNTNPFAVPNNYMANGSLTFGDTLLNYGNGTNWTTNTAGLLMECADNTEIAIYDVIQDK
jgi:hypothetical protein